MAEISVELNSYWAPTPGDVAAATGLLTLVKVAESSVRGYRRRRLKRREDRENEEQLLRLLGLRQGDWAYRHANTHPLYQGVAEVHPDNLEAFHAVSGPDYHAGDRAGSLEVHDSLSSDHEKSLVLVGSPTSEGLSRVVFGYEQVIGDDESLALKAAPYDFPFRMVLDLGAINGATADRYVPGKGRVTRPNWRIVSDTDSFTPVARNGGLLETDYLLVTRMPNFLSDKARNEGHGIVTVGGTHGTGTTGVELLMNDRAVIRDLGDRLANANAKGDGGRAFQAVFEVGKMKHDERRGSHARAIRLADFKLLQGRVDDWRPATAAVGPRVAAWLAERTA